MQEGWKNLAKKYDLNINITGIPPLSHWQIETGDSQLLHTIVVEKMIERGFLTSNAFYATYAHTKEHVNSYLNALNDVLGELVPYVESMWKILQYEKPEDFVIATGESHSVKEFVELAFAEAGLDWKKYVIMDERFMRPADVPDLRGDISKAKRKLGWGPDIKFQQLVKMMVDADYKLLNSK